jgi:hypothetical protein
VEKLVHAGLITCYVDIAGTEEHISEDYSSLNVTASEVFDNGSIWVGGDWLGEGTLTKEGSARKMAEDLAEEEPQGGVQ